MDIVKTSKNITKTFRSVSRSREIISVFTRHGFEEFVVQGARNKIPIIILPKTKNKILEELERDTNSSWQQVLGYRLRLCFEELGPAFIKFGQLLSSREDLFDSGFISEMEKLRDKVKPVPFELAKQSIEEALGGKISDFFDYINPKAIGTASIGVVYEAKLKNGEEVVVKVRRPNIERMIETDFSILLFLVNQIERTSAELKGLGLSRIIKDFSSSLQSELNFNVEALSCDRFRENLSARDVTGIFYVPKIYKDLTKENILVMEKINGIPFSDREGVAPVIDKIHEKLETGLQYFMKSFLQDGFFHADLHGGNFFYMENEKIGIIDYGLMGTLGKKSRINFIAIIYALITFNYENLVYEFLDVAEYNKTPDVDNLINDVKDALSPFIGLTVKQTNYSEVFKVITSCLLRHELFLPRDWFIVFRALMTLDGVGKSLNMDIDIFGLLESDMTDVLRSTVDKNEILEELVWATRDILPILRIFPRHLKWFLKDFAKKNYEIKLRHTGYESQIIKVAGSIKFLSFSLFSASLVISGVLLNNGHEIKSYTDISIISYIFWISGLLFFLRGIFNSKK